jgi:hypothetical protein
MATYAELLTAFEDVSLRQKIRVAISVAADTIRTDPSPPPNQSKRLKWAAGALVNPDALVDQMTRAAVIQNKAATYASIIGASDATVQTAVDAAVDLFADLLEVV